MFLPDALRQRLGGLRALPPVPEHFVALTRMLGDDSQAPSLSDIASILAKDVALAARILQLANSAFFGGGAFAGNLEQAVKLLGLRLISGLVLQHEVFTNMELSPETARWRDSLNRESLATADLASRIARQQGAEPRQRDEAYLAGLLLDTGRLVLATEDHVPVDADRLREGLYGAELCLEEETLFGVHHGWAGAYLLQLWGFPRSVVEAVAWHHQPSGSGVEGVSTLTRAYLADALASIRRGEAVALDWEYLQSIGYSRDAEAWADVPELQELVSCAAGAA